MGCLANAEFIAHSREDVEWLLGEVNRLRKIIGETADGVLMKDGMEVFCICGDKIRKGKLTKVTGGGSEWHWESKDRHGGISSGYVSNNNDCYFTREVADKLG